MTPSFTFCPTERAVFFGPHRLSEESCEAILDVFEREGAVRPYLDLYEAGQKAGFIARCTSLRAA